MTTGDRSAGIDVLRDRVAVLADQTRGGVVVLNRGSLATPIGGCDDDALRLGVDSDDATECSVAVAETAMVDSDGSLPREGRLSIVFSAIVGSRAQGLATDASDTDRRGFYVASPDIHFGLRGSPDQLVHDGDQLCYWEAEKFLRLALGANPTVLETLYSPQIELAGPAIWPGLSELRLRGAFLSKRAEQTFVGYAESQFTKMSRSRERGMPIKWQHAMHLVRLLRVGERLMRTGELSVAVPPEERDELLAIRRGERTWEDVCRLREQLSASFASAARGTPLPDSPDVEAVERLLIELRLLGIEEACR